jgi:hypothetical protein
VCITQPPPGIWNVVYEYLRFFKLVEVSKIGYFREMLFGMMIMVLAFFFFRKVKFTRER